MFSSGDASSIFKPLSNGLARMEHCSTLNCGTIPPSSLPSLFRFFRFPMIGEIVNDSTNEMTSERTEAADSI